VSAASSLVQPTSTTGGVQPTAKVTRRFLVDRAVLLGSIRVVEGSAFMLRASLSLSPTDVKQQDVEAHHPPSASFQWLYYNMASEYLKCTRCKRRYISWSDAVLSQLSLRRRAKFPAILTYRYACDMEVVGMMRNAAWATVARSCTGSWSSNTD